MARNLGRIRMEWRRTTQGLLGLPHSVKGGKPMQDYAPEKGGYMYLIVDADGIVRGGSHRSTGCMIEGHDIWEVEGDDVMAALGKRWDGEKLVEP
jgi:hypothetical protein